MTKPVLIVRGCGTYFSGLTTRGYGGQEACIPLIIRKGVRTSVKATVNVKNVIKGKVEECQE